jgi:hypothetical protein
MMPAVRYLKQSWHISVISLLAFVACPTLRWKWEKFFPDADNFNLELILV